MCEEEGGKQGVSVEDLEAELLQEDHKVVLSIPLESPASHPARRRQLVLVSSRAASKQTYCILGVDVMDVLQAGDTAGQPRLRLGFVLKVLWGLETRLDGDGGFGLHQLGDHFMFKPASLQLLWTVIQTLHAITASLQPRRDSLSLRESDWVRYYQENITSPQSYINTWLEMSDILSKRPPSPDLMVSNTRQTKTVIKIKLREIMKTVNLDDITCKAIRQRLEREMEQSLAEYKMMIDEEILLILGQMDPASKIFDFLYLGSEWNASNLEELQANGVTHILNVTREIDNFFPAVFKYLNIREYDVEETDLLQYWDSTYRFLKDCVDVEGRVLVHCKMGISRSASTVIAFAMKHFSWSLEEALSHTAGLRAVVNPNPAFREQLVTYEGILSASRQRYSFRKPNRAKSKSCHSKPSKEPNSLSHLPRSPSESSINSLQSRNTDNRSPRRRSWGARCKCVETDRGALEYHCVSQLLSYIQDPATSTTTIATTATTTATTDGECPQSSLAQCTCGDLELELSVSEVPVDIFEVTAETEKIITNMGSLPLTIRQSRTAPLSEIYTTDLSNINQPVITQQQQQQQQQQDPSDNKKLDSGISEELSVKTLANMFDFRLSDPSMRQSLHHLQLIRESKIDSNKYSPPIDVNTCSEC